MWPFLIGAALVFYMRPAKTMRIALPATPGDARKLPGSPVNNPEKPAIRLPVQPKPISVEGRSLKF